MKIATNHEMTNKQEMIMNRIANGEHIGTFSIQYGDDHANDLFTGTRAQCIASVKRFIRAGFDVKGIALIELGNDLSCVDCHGFESI